MQLIGWHFPGVYDHSDAVANVRVHAKTSCSAFASAGCQHDVW